MPKYILIMPLISFRYSVYCQEGVHLISHADTVAQLKSLITNHHLLSSAGVSVVGSPSKPFYRFAYLLSIATPEELIAIVNDSCRYLRIYGYIGVLYTNDSNRRKIRRKLRHDHTIINTISGCICDQMSISKAVKNIRKWYSKKGFDWIFKKYISDDNFAGFSINSLLVIIRSMPHNKNLQVQK